MTAATMMDTVCISMVRLLFLRRDMHITTMTNTRHSTPASITPTKGQNE